MHKFLQHQHVQRHYHRAQVALVAILLTTTLLEVNWATLFNRAHLISVAICAV